MPKLRQWSDERTQWEYIDVPGDDVRLLNTQEARDEVAYQRLEVLRLIGEWGEETRRADAAEADAAKLRARVAELEGKHGG